VSPSEPLTWRLFSAEFTSPPGYTLVSHRIALGDIALELRHGDGRRLVLRQVFPAGLATQRRSLERWLDDSAFAERRRLRPESTSRGTQDVSQHGWKRFPAPMGWLKPRYCARRACVHEDRIYIAETQSRAPRGANDGADVLDDILSCQGVTL
jgi:hypothetical protein